MKRYNSNWSQIPDHPYRILIIVGSGSGKTNSLFNLISYQPDVDKIYLYAKNPYEAKCKLLISKRESTDLTHLNDSKAVIKYLNDMNNIYKNIEEYNINRKRKMLIVFDDMIADMLRNEKLNPIVTELFIRGSELNISLVFIPQLYFAVPKNRRINFTYYSIMKIPNKQELQQIAFDHSPDINFRDFMNLYKKFTANPCSFLVINTTFASDNPFLERIF